MKNLALCLLLLILATLPSATPSFSLKKLFHHDSVEGVDINLDNGHTSVVVKDNTAELGAVAVADAVVTGEKGAATGKGEGKGTITLNDDTKVTAFADATEKKYRFKFLDLGYEHATGGFKIEKNGASSEEKKESKTRFTVGLHIGNKVKTFSTPTFNF